MENLILISFDFLGVRIDPGVSIVSFKMAQSTTYLGIVKSQGPWQCIGTLKLQFFQWFGSSPWLLFSLVNIG